MLRCEERRPRLPAAWCWGLQRQPRWARKGCHAVSPLELSVADCQRGGLSLRTHGVRPPSMRGPRGRRRPGRPQWACAAAGPWGSGDTRLPRACCDWVGPAPCLGLPRAWPPWAQEGGGLTSFPPSPPLGVVLGPLQGSARSHWSREPAPRDCPLSLQEAAPGLAGPPGWWPSDSLTLCLGKASCPQ